MDHGTAATHLASDVDYEIKNVRTQLKALSGRTSRKVELTRDLSEFLTRQAEIEMTYAKSLDALYAKFSRPRAERATMLGAAAKALRRPTEEEDLNSSGHFSSLATGLPTDVWQVLLDQIKKRADARQRFALHLGDEMKTRLESLERDTTVASKKCLDYGGTIQVELQRTLKEVEDTMKVYHSNHAKLIKANESLEKAKKQGKKTEKAKEKVQQCEVRTTAARNSYVLALAGANAFKQRYYKIEVRELVNCMDVHYHDTFRYIFRLYRDLSMQAEAIVNKSIQTVYESADAVSGAADKKKFFSDNRVLFQLTKKLAFMAARDDELDSVQCNTVDVNQLIQDYQEYDGAVGKIDHVIHEEHKTLNAVLALRREAPTAPTDDKGIDNLSMYVDAFSRRSRKELERASFTAKLAVLGKALGPNKPPTSQHEYMLDDSDAESLQFEDPPRTASRTPSMHKSPSSASLTGTPSARGSISMPPKGTVTEQTQAPSIELTSPQEAESDLQDEMDDSELTPQPRPSQGAKTMVASPLMQQMRQRLSTMSKQEEGEGDGSGAGEGVGEGNGEGDGNGREEGDAASSSQSEGSDTTVSKEQPSRPAPPSMSAAVSTTGSALSVGESVPRGSQHEPVMLADMDRADSASVVARRPAPAPPGSPKLGRNTKRPVKRPERPPEPKERRNSRGKMPPPPKPKAPSSLPTHSQTSRQAPPEVYAFGCSLEVFAEATGQDVPPLVSSCVRVLRHNALDEEGLFRVPGSSTQIDELKSAFESGNDPLKDGLPPHIHPEAVAGLLKLYLRQLANPVMTTEHYKTLVQIGTTQDVQLRLMALRKVATECIPPAHLAVLRELMPFLARVASHADKNKMSVSNLALVFGPTLMPAPKDDMGAMLRDATAVNTIMTTLIEENGYILGLDDSAPTDEPKETDQVADSESDMEELPPPPVPGAEAVVPSVEIPTTNPDETSASAEAGQGQDEEALPAAPAPPAPPVEQPEPEQTPAMQCVAKFDYSGRNDSELTFQKGDVLQVTENSNESWWKGSHHGREGFIAAAYVEMLSQDAADASILSQDDDDGYLDIAEARTRPVTQIEPVSDVGDGGATSVAGAQAMLTRKAPSRVYLDGHSQGSSSDRPSTAPTEDEQDEDDDDDFIPPPPPPGNRGSRFDIRAQSFGPTFAPPPPPPAGALTAEDSLPPPPPAQVQGGPSAPPPLDDLPPPPPPDLDSDDDDFVPPPPPPQ
eukprot:m.39909 g.39909  ORF g.39909 m.39909 type:complete len:1225 (-) comp10365_c0_seq4:3299-6973(-)